MSQEEIASHVVVAPMVRGSELAFRMLMRSLYPGITCYTPMLRAEAVVRAFETKAHNGNEEEMLFLSESCPQDEPIVVQLCGNNPLLLKAACRAIMQHYHSIAGIDYNLGCPQTCAKDGNFGAFLAENEPMRALECVKAMASVLRDTTVQLSCKIRLSDSVEKTVEVAKALQDAGCNVLAVHCRKRTAKFDGFADLQAGKSIVDALSIPVWINGAEITSFPDVLTVQRVTGSSKIMTARPLLANPFLFLPKADSSRPETAASLYLEYARQFPPPDYRYLQLHLRWIFRRHLASSTQGWKQKLWNFLARPYLVEHEQWRHIVALYVTEDGCLEMPVSLRDIDPIPTYKSIRNYRTDVGEIDAATPFEF